MERREKGWRTASIVIGSIGAALLIAVLVLRILKHEVLYLVYPLVGIVILFLITDERARMLKRKRLKEEAERDGAQEPAQPDPEETLPKEAFEFEEKQP